MHSHRLQKRRRPHKYLQKEVRQCETQTTIGRGNSRRNRTNGGRSQGCSAALDALPVDKDRPRDFPPLVHERNHRRFGLSPRLLARFRRQCQRTENGDESLPRPRDRQYRTFLLRDEARVGPRCFRLQRCERVPAESVPEQISVREHLRVLLLQGPKPA